MTSQQRSNKCLTAKSTSNGQKVCAMRSGWIISSSVWWAGFEGSRFVADVNVSSRPPDAGFQRMSRNDNHNFWHHKRLEYFMYKAQVSRTIQFVMQRYNFTNTEAVSKEDDHEFDDHAVHCIIELNLRLCLMLNQTFSKPMTNFQRICG